MNTNIKCPDWVHGCPNCINGLVDAPPLTGRESVYMERLVQAADGNLQFCTCRAGHMYRQFLRRHYAEMRDMTATIGGISQPVGKVMLEQARHNIASNTDFVPTIRYQPPGA